MYPYLARIVNGRVHVYALRERRPPKVWVYPRERMFRPIPDSGVAAIDDSPVRAVAAALRVFRAKI